MKKSLLILGTAVLMLTSCTKEVQESPTETPTETTPPPPAADFVKHTIQQGQQTSDRSTFVKVKYNEQVFKVKFDSSAIYKTIFPENQKDINKLFGFSDNNGQHHQFSARFGWRWSNDALRLFAYTYNNGVRGFKEMGTVEIGAEAYCSIKVTATSYIFTLNDKVETMPRTSPTPIAEGYKLFPYFGGDEMAPHTISIWIKEL